MFYLIYLISIFVIRLLAWNLMEDHERHKIIDNLQKLLPISLIGFRNIFPNNFKDFFNINLLSSWSNSEHIKPLTSSIDYGSITNKIQNSLSPEEYNNLINHVNVYVQKLIDSKLETERLNDYEKQKEISNGVSLLIATTVRENILALIPSQQRNENDPNFKLKDSDFEKIISQVHLKLSNTENFNRISLSKENLDEITKLIKNNIEINNNYFNILEHINIEEILFRIIDSPELTKFIDSRIINSIKMSPTVAADNQMTGSLKFAENEKFDKQQLIIDELINEISLIKRTMSDKINENQNLYDSIDMLIIGQNEFTARLNKHELNANSRFDSLLTEIDEKISNLNEKQFALINQQIKLSLMEIFDYSGSIKNIDEIDLKNWIRNMFVAKELLEDKLKELNLQYDARLKDEIDQSGMILMKNINEKLKVEILKAIELKQKELGINLNVKTSIAEDEIRKIVQGALAIYDADKTGLVDYALESAGGQILSTRCTENFQKKSAQISIFGIPLWYASNTPRTVISPAVQPGECWSFQGFPGFLGFTLEHIPKSLTPTGKIDSAPKNFTVWGLEKENDLDPVQFGNYEYSDEQSPLQYFPVQNKNIDKQFDIVELRIESNHGNIAYTCLYRFRVHGKTTT